MTENIYVGVTLETTAFKMDKGKGKGIEGNEVIRIDAKAEEKERLDKLIQAYIGRLSRLRAYAVPSRLVSFCNRQL